jgi:hypothetical protein
MTFRPTQVEIYVLCLANRQCMQLLRHKRRRVCTRTFKTARSRLRNTEQRDLLQLAAHTLGNTATGGPVHLPPLTTSPEILSWDAHVFL